MNMTVGRKQAASYVCSLFAGVLPIMLMLSGCAEPRTASQGNQEAQTLVLRVWRGQEHLGHSTDAESSVHRAWYDGCLGQLDETDEQFVVWWNNNEIDDYSFRFEDGKTYVIEFRGPVEERFGSKCLHVSQIIKVQEK